MDMEKEKNLVIEYAVKNNFPKKVINGIKKCKDASTISSLRRCVIEHNLNWMEASLLL